MPSIKPTIRDAQSTDIAGLAAIKLPDHPAVHRDRLEHAEQGYLRLLVAEVAGRIVGYSLLVFKRPMIWSDGCRTDRLPQAVDLFVAEADPGHGIGTSLLSSMEKLTTDTGYNRLYIAVDPVDNLEAYALYTHLGYQALQIKPYWDAWRFTDSVGEIHQGEGWVVDMLKILRGI